MPLNLEPSSSQFSIPEYDPPPSSARVGWSHSNPESLLLKQQLKDGPVQPNPDPFLSSRASVPNHHLPSLTLLNPLPSNHPAKAKRFAPRQEDSPSLPQHIDEFHSAIDKMNDKVHRNAKQKAHKSRRDFGRPNPDSSSKSTAEKSEHSLKNPLRREHSFQDAVSPPSDKPSRLQARASESNITALCADEDRDLSSPFPGSSQHISRSILDTLRKPMDIDWDNIPSNTPTPPCRRHMSRFSVDSGSFKDKNDSEASSSSSSPLSLATRHCSRAPLNSPQDDVSMIDEDAQVSKSLSDPPNNSPLMSDQAYPILGQPSPEVPSPLTLMPPPLRTLSTSYNPPPAQLTQSTTLPAPTSSPLSRPFAPPSQARPTQTQSARPRASQRPRPLGMCRAPGQSSTSGGVNKPYKLPLPTRPKRPPPAPAPYRSGQYAEAPVESTPLLSEGCEEDRRSISPVIPDPPHIAARAQMLASQSPALQMSARRPEPRGDEDEDVKDADSSADLWACFD
ncbi:hypothetical protein GSI_10356 [Ganoderma sinense ZZ0214-1]|uniref:Uncharacterized protein n=1 Tax=Ganoderma sinense ZZ0214-1 TaxID=1077348 RepID=A0A2G8S0B8_9APHY|nr:hypothetical protein GSI_10356 [Ganoderma sinense ZZ0214-1]